MNMLHRLLAGLLAWLALAAHAKEFPSRPNRIVVPASFATTPDLTARFLAEQMSRALGVSVVVDNRTGGNGILAVTNLRASPPDGHTLLPTDCGIYPNAALYESVPYDPVKDLRILGGLNQVLPALVVAPAFAPSTVKQLVDHARDRPVEVTYASASVGSSTHLGPELLAGRAGVELRHIPYKSGAQAVTDVAAGHVSIAMTAVPTAAPLVAAGKPKAFAVTGSHRSALLPDMPTLQESGIANAQITSRQALVAPAGIPEATAAGLTAVVSRILATPEYARLLAANGIEKELVPPDAYAKTGAKELRRWIGMVALSGAKFD